MGGGLSQTSVSPWRCTSARALPGFDSMCRMREACAYSTGSSRPARTPGSRMTLRSRSAFFTRRSKRTTLCPGGAGARFVPALSSIAYGSTGGFNAPGVSRCVESISIQSGGRELPRKRRAAEIGDVLNALARREPVRDVDDLPLGVAVDEEVGLGVEQDRAAHLLRPVVEVRDATQRGLDAADDDRHVPERLAGALRVHDHRAIRTLAAFAAGRVRVVAADAPVGGVAVHHRVHVPGGDAEEQIRRARARRRLRRCASRAAR